MCCAVVGSVSADLLIQLGTLWTQSRSCWDRRSRVSRMRCTHGTWGQSESLWPSVSRLHIFTVW